MGGSLVDWHSGADPDYFFPASRMHLILIHSGGVNF